MLDMTDESKAGIVVNSEIVAPSSKALQDFQESMTILLVLLNILILSELYIYLNLIVDKIRVQRYILQYFIFPIN